MTLAVADAMKTKTWKYLLRGGVVVASGTTLSGCFTCGYGNCGETLYAPFDGGFGDAGLVALPDGGSEYDAGAFRTPDGGFTPEGCNVLCPKDHGYWSYCGMDGGLVECRIQCVGGRLPPGQHSLSGIDGSAGSWLARMAELETGAVRAFEHLAHELDAHGLADFATHALDAAADEVRHAEAITRLALSAGHCPHGHAVRPTPVRSLLEVALDNAAEGCGRELIGAEINARQASTASNAQVRATMAAITPDERAHGALSLELARTLMPRLTVSERRQVREAQEMSLLRFDAESAAGLNRAAQRSLGLLEGEQLETLSRRLLETSRV